MMQVYVVRDKKKSQTFVFPNHEAALRCRQELKLNHWSLTGCVINDDWVNGAPVRQKEVNHE